MGQWRRLVVAAAVSSVLVVLFVPNTLLWTTRAVRTAVEQVVAGVRNPAARPLILGLTLLGLLVLSFLAIFWIVRIFTSVGVSRSSKLRRVYDEVSPDSPRTKGLVFMLAFTVVFLVGVATFVPYLATSLTEGSDIDQVFRDVEEGQYDGDLRQLFADDAVTPNSSTVAYKQAGVDTDGDGLPNEWERRGQTPGGVSLPGADPGQLDLYVQLNYGENTTALTSTEREKLREIWASMPVENPDGSTGIDLHLAVGSPRASALDDAVVADGKSAVDTYYTEAVMGGRYCVFHQVVLGKIREDGDIGYAEAPGRAVFLDGRPFTDYNGDYPFRSVMITHGLLHTVVGTVGGSVHSSGGWLDYPSGSNEQLSEAVATKLEGGFVTSEAYRRQCSDARQSALSRP